MNTRLIKILEESIRRHGDKPLTLSHLCNMLKMEDRIAYTRAENKDHRSERYMDDLYEKYHTDINPT